MKTTTQMGFFQRPVKNILVIKLRHIGDVLLTVPAIRALKEHFPAASISALVNSGTDEMLTQNPLFDEIIVFDRAIKVKRLTRRLGGELGFIKGLRKRSFDMTVDLTGGDRPALIGLLTGAKYRLGYDPKGSGFIGKRLLYTHRAKKPVVRTHTVLRELGLLKEFGITTKDLGVNIYASDEDDFHTAHLLRENGISKETPFVHVHPTSRWLFKCWTDEGMASIMDSLNDAGIRTVITSGPAEAERKKVGSIIALMKSTPVDFSGLLTLKRLSCLSRRALFFLGVDSAPMHIAAATGTRVIGIFGPSGAFDWGPWDNAAATKAGIDGFHNNAGGGVNSPYPLKNGIQTFGGNTAVQLDWECVPCGKDGCKGSKKSDCLDSLSVEVVWKAVAAMIGSSGQTAVKWSSRPDR